MNGYWITGIVVAVIVIGLAFLILPDLIRYIRISRM
jgi:hypothetical protein